eukprot:GHVR01008382.1.p1 GENE.GHVR01008382.1~~GHVR01008382.1.p1  ORF type:complete len:212 (+),score=52.35 GHVR01008382.1:46-636(+)
MVFASKVGTLVLSRGFGTLCQSACSPVAKFSLLGATGIFGKYKYYNFNRVECQSPEIFINNINKNIVEDREEVTVKTIKSSTTRKCLMNICVGSLVGLFLGGALRRIGHLITSALGVYLLLTEVFILLEYITINWSKVSEDITNSQRRHINNNTHTHTHSNILARGLDIGTLILSLGGGIYMGFAVLFANRRHRDM